MVEKRIETGAENEEFDLTKSYSYILENINDLIAIIEIGDSFKFEYLNEAIFLKALGYSNKDLLGQSILDYIYSDDLDEITRLFNESSDELHEIRFKDKNGDFKWFNLNIKRFKHHDNREKYLLVLRDITENKNLTSEINNILDSDQELKKSEEKYRTFIEQSLMGILEYDIKKKDFSYVNPKLLKIFGYEDEKEFNIKTFQKCIYPDDLEKFHEATKKNTLDYRIYNKNGETKWISSHRANNYNDEGELVNFRVWLEDVTEKKLYENLIYELNINFLNFTTDVQQNIELLLETCSKLLNASVTVYCQKRMEEGMEIIQLISSDKKILNCNLEEFNNNYIMSELFHETHDFTQTIVDLNEFKYSKTDPFIKDYNAIGCIGKLIRTEGKFNSAICTFFEKNIIITHQHVLILFLLSDAINIEHQRWQVTQHLEEQNIFKTELLSRTSHELKTPLISIKGFTDLLLTLHSSKMDTDMISILEDIKEGSRRLEEIINSLIESSKLDQGQLELNKATEDLTFLIKFVARDLRGLIEMRNQNLNLKIHEYLTASFDKERMYEVISNLVVNAIKYTPPGGTIAIKSEIKEKFYIISVEDNGIGVTKEEKNQLFKQFGKIERYGKGWDVDAEGSGLGLYISKKLVELHGGEIWLESEGRNKGSKFYFSLPFIP